MICYYSKLMETIIEEGNFIFRKRREGDFDNNLEWKSAGEFTLEHKSKAVTMIQGDLEKETFYFGYITTVEKKRCNLYATKAIELLERWLKLNTTNIIKIVCVTEVDKSGYEKSFKKYGYEMGDETKDGFCYPFKKMKN